MTDRSVYGGGASSGGLRVPPGAEVGVPLTRSTPVAVTAGGGNYAVVWTDNDDSGDPLPAGAVAFPDQKITLNAAHVLPVVDEDGYYRWRTTVNLTAGSSGATVSVTLPDGSVDHLTIPADALDASRGRGVWPYAGGSLALSVGCIAGDVTVGTCTLYAHRLSE